MTNLGAVLILLKLAQQSGFTVSPKTGPTAPPIDIPTNWGITHLEFQPPGIDPESEFAAREDDVPQCAFDETLTWIPGQQKYVCLPSLK